MNSPAVTQARVFSRFSGDRVKHLELPEEPSALSKMVNRVAFAIFSAIPGIGMGYFVTTKITMDRAKLAKKTAEDVQKFENSAYYDPKVVPKLEKHLKELKEQSEWKSFALLSTRTQFGSMFALASIFFALKLGMLSAAVAWPITIGIIGLFIIYAIILNIKENKSIQSETKEKLKRYNDEMSKRYKDYSNFNTRILKEFEKCETIQELEACYKREKKALKSDEFLHDLDLYKTRRMLILTERPFDVKVDGFSPKEQEYLKSQLKLNPALALKSRVSAPVA